MSGIPAAAVGMGGLYLLNEYRKKIEETGDPAYPVADFLFERFNLAPDDPRVNQLIESMQQAKEKASGLIGGAMQASDGT